MSNDVTADKKIAAIDDTLDDLAIVLATLTISGTIDAKAAQLAEDTHEKLQRLLEVVRDKASEIEY